jgi:Uma2 family endonuclease
VDVLLVADEEEDGQVDTAVQPYLVIVCSGGKVQAEAIRGAPHLVIEVLSPTTAYKDQTAKLKLYREHGIPEFWIANPEADTVFVYQIGPEGRYGRPLNYLSG